MEQFHPYRTAPYINFRCCENQDWDKAIRLMKELDDAFAAQLSEDSLVLAAFIGLYIRDEEPADES